MSTLGVTLPIFALILAGYLARKGGALGPSAVSEINRFVVYLALPALLFEVMATTSWRDLYQPGFVMAFGLACGIVFFATLFGRILLSGRSLADASIDGLNAAYANTAYIGFPLCLLVFGRDSLVLVSIASIITVCVMFASAIVLMEIGLQAERRPLLLAGKVFGALARNPLVIAPLLGTIYGLAGLSLPESAASFLKLLGGAASPCALVALGLFLAEGKTISSSERWTSAVLTTLKLIAQPALTWFLAAKVFALPPEIAYPAILLSALPTGTGPFMLASLYNRDGVVTSNTVLYSTVAGLVTVTLWLAILGLGGGVGGT